jgi:hypothetical protein
VAEAFRAEWGRVVASLIGVTGDWDLAGQCAGLEPGGEGPRGRPLAAERALSLPVSDLPGRVYPCSCSRNLPTSGGRGRQCVLECDDLDQAIENSARHPTARFGAFELRPYTAIDVTEDGH